MTKNTQNKIAAIVADVMSEKLGAPISGGNSFESQTQMQIKSNIAAVNADEIATANVNKQIDNAALNGIRRSLNLFVKKLTQNKTYQDYQILQFHGNYFCNTIQFYASDIKLSKLINAVIRGAFMWGKAAIYFDDIGSNEVPMYYPRAVYVSDTELDNYDNIVSAKIYPLNKMTWNAYGSNEELDSLKTQELNERQCENLVIFQWGTTGMGAYLWLYPFIRFQNQLLTQSIIDSGFQTTKLEFLSSNISTSTRELETVADPLNPFFVSYIGNTVQQKFRAFEMNPDKNQNFNEYYKQVIGIWYELIGRETNIDYKSKTLASEVSLTENVFAVLQNEYKKWFDIFMRQLQVHDYVALNKIVLEWKDYRVEHISRKEQKG